MEDTLCEEIFHKVEAKEREREAAGQEEPDKTRWKAFIKSPQFDMAMGTMILINMLLIILRVQYEGTIGQPGGDVEPIPALEVLLLISDHVFATIFLLELILRLLAVGIRYLWAPMNILDIVIVVISCLDMWCLSANEGAFGISTLRVFRLLRLMKVMRLVRFMNAFKPLRVLVTAVTNSIGALLWSMILLFLFELIAAIFFAQTLQFAIADEERDFQSRQYLWSNFGTMLRAWLTVFEITMAPGGFIAHRRLYDEVNPLFSFALVFYVCLVTFAVIRVITAMFLKETLAAADLDGKRAKEYMVALRRAYAEKLCEELEKSRGAAPGQGRISREALGKLLGFKRMSDWLEDMELTPDEIEKLFCSLEHSDGYVILTDFLACLTAIYRDSRGREVILQRESHKILNMLTKVQIKQKQVQDQLARGSHWASSAEPSTNSLGQKWTSVMPCSKGFLARIAST